MPVVSGVSARIRSLRREYQVGIERVKGGGGVGGRQADRRTEISLSRRRPRNAVGQGREDGGGVSVNRIGRSRRRLDAGGEATSHRPAGGGGAE